MEDSQIEHVGMFVKVKTFLNKKGSELAATPAIAATIQPALITKIDEILDEDEDASSPITGSTELKRNLESIMENRGFTVAAACVSYYTLTLPNPVLRAKCELQQSDFKRMRDSAIYVKLKKVHEIADPIKTLLTSYGVSATDVDDFSTALDNYFAQLEAPFDARDERAASGKQVNRLILEAREILDKQLDVVMKYYVTNNPELYDYYKNARAIDQTGGGPIPDVDDEFALAVGAYQNSDVEPEITAATRLVITNKTGSGAPLQIGFSTAPNSFSSTPVQLLPGETGDYTALQLNFATGIAQFVFYAVPVGGASGSVAVRVKVYY